MNKGGSQKIEVRIKPSILASSVVSHKYVYKTSFPLVMLSEAKHLLLLEHIGDKQILR